MSDEDFSKLVDMFIDSTDVEVIRRTLQKYKFDDAIEVLGEMPYKQRRIQDENLHNNAIEDFVKTAGYDKD